MGLKTMSTIRGASATITVAGGSALVFAEDGVTVPNGLHLMVPGDSDYQTRRQCTVKYRPPTLDPKTGVYGKDKKGVTLVFPMSLSDGRVVFNTLRLEREVHPSFEPEQAADLLRVGAQILWGTDAADFWANGSLS